MPASTISATTLAQMVADAAAMKSELHVGNHVRALADELRRLAEPTVRKPTLDEVTAALAFLKHTETCEKLDDNTAAVHDAALAVCGRFFAA